MRAELAWAQLTGKAPAIFGDFSLADLPRRRPEPIAPRGRGRRQQKATRPVLVETKSKRVLSLPDGSRLAVKRTRQSYIAA
jgi:hypothetical protein